MANLQGYELTVTGRALLAKAGTGACTLNFTKVKLGADETSLNDLINKTDLVGTNIKQIDIVGSQANEATFTIIATVTNSGMQDNFLIRQVGIFAKGVAATNPGTGVAPEDVNETLFAVAYDTQPDIIPAESITPYTRQFNANMTITNVEQCDVTLTPAGVVTVQVLNNHNDNSEAHGNLIKRLFGSATATMESVKQKIEDWAKNVCLPLSGGKMKGSIDFPNETNTDLDLITAKMSEDDYFRIRIGGDVDNGYAEIATADNGNEPIYIRQYSGGLHDFSNLLRTATILDEDGNTSFPGNVTADNGFKGNLNGNAKTATRATEDSAGNNINTTYIKNITNSDGTITITKGNGITSKIVINNVSNANSTKKIENEAVSGSAVDLITGTMADSDYFRIRIGGDVDNGYAEIATADGGNEPIYIRQYSGGLHDFSSLKRTATILDENGNTSFPGNVTANGAMYSATPSTTDNSTRLATTAFVKAQSAKMSTNLMSLMAVAQDNEEQYIVDQYWIKDSSGTINQYMEINLNEKQELDVQFPISFPQKCLFLDIEIINIEKDININCNFHIIEKTTDGAKLLKVGTGNPKKIIVKATGI